MLHDNFYSAHSLPPISIRMHVRTESYVGNDLILTEIDNCLVVLILDMTS